MLTDRHAQLSFQDSHFTPANVTVVGVGMDASVLKPLVRELESLGGSSTARVASKYVGGKATVEGDADSAYVAIAFGNNGAAAADASVMTVLEHLLGAGVQGSRGLGGHATSLFNTQVASKVRWVEDFQKNIVECRHHTIARLIYIEQSQNVTSAMNFASAMSFLMVPHL